MLTKEEFQKEISSGCCFLDGATGSNLRRAGMPLGCCAEQWVLENPEALVQLQRGYAEAGSQILYAPTFQAQPLALARIGWQERTEEVNAKLVALSRSAAPNCLIAGDLTTMAGFCDSWNPELYDTLVENYRVQIHGLMDGGADLLVAETLMYPQEAEAVLEAAYAEGSCAVMCSFTMQADGALFFGQPAGPVLRSLEEADAAAVGFNCVAADETTPHLVSLLRRFTRLPMICKPNAGMPTINASGEAEYDLPPDAFASILKQCAQNGAALLGGCCGTTPEYIAAAKACIQGGIL